jgi:hypothetical protein
MIIRLFRTSQPVAAFLLLIPIIAASWSSFYYHFITVPANGMPFYDGMLFLIGTLPTWVRVSISMALIYLQAIHLQYILNKHEVLYKESWMPALMYILLATFLPEFQWFHPMLFINSILLFALDRIFFLYKNDKPLALDFDVGFIIGIATLFYMPLLIYIFFFGAALILLRPFSWRDWATGIIGVFLPLFFAFCYYFLTDRFTLLFEKLYLSGISRPQHISDLLPREYILALIAPGLITIAGLMKQFTNFYKNVTKTRLNQLVILLFAVTGLLAAVFAETPQVYRFLLLAIPASVWAGYYLLSLKKLFIAELLFLMAFAGWIFTNFLAK